DLNRDGNADLLGLSTGAHGPVSVSLGNGDGTFQSSVDFSDPNIVYPSGFVAGDFNGDGKPDVAVTYWVGVTVFAGNGDGTLSVSGKSTLAGVPGGFAMAGDFNGDGRLDFVFDSYASGGFFVEIGNGDGTFQAGAQF